MFPKFSTYLKNIKNNAKQTLPLVASNFKTEEMRLILEALKSNTTVISVWCGTGLPVEIYHLLADALAVNTGVKNLFFGAGEDDIYEYILEKLQTNTALKKIELYLPKTAMTLNKVNLLANFVRDNKSLIHMELYGNEQAIFDISTIECLIKGLRNSRVKTLRADNVVFENRSLEKLMIFFIESKILVNLVLYACNVQDETLIHLANLCKHASKKKVLVLQKNPITEKGLEPLANAILKNEKLFVHYTAKRDNGTLFRFESVYITPHLQRDSKKELKSFYHIV